MNFRIFGLLAVAAFSAAVAQSRTVDTDHGRKANLEVLSGVGGHQHIKAMIATYYES